MQAIYDRLKGPIEFEVCDEPDVKEKRWLRPGN